MYPGQKSRFSLRKAPWGEKQNPHARVGKPVARQMGTQVSRGHHPEVSEEGSVRAIESARRSYSAELCDQRGVELVEGKAMSDHVHMCLSIPPKFSVAHTVGFLKGKSAVRIHRELLKERRMTGLHFWATGYCVSTVGLDEDRIRKYIREQDTLESGQGDLDLK